jgi:hypothetical protein
VAGNLILVQEQGFPGVGGRKRLSAPVCCPWSRGVGLEVLPPRLIPCWQNKQGEVIVCVDKYGLVRGLRVGGALSPFILGGMKNLKLPVYVRARNEILILAGKGKHLPGFSPSVDHLCFSQLFNSIYSFIQ